MSKKYSTQNDLLMDNLLEFYKNEYNLQTMLNIINGESRISLRIVDWFATNYAKKNFTVYIIEKSYYRKVILDSSSMLSIKKTS